MNKPMNGVYMNKVAGSIKEAAGFIKEEMYEHGDSVKDKVKAQEGRDLRNEGRAEQGKAPKVTTPGTGAEEDEDENN
jgi:hypothetical protein